MSIDRHPLSAVVGVCAFILLALTGFPAGAENAEKVFDPSQPLPAAVDLEAMDPADIQARLNVIQLELPRLAGDIQTLRSEVRDRRTRERASNEEVQALKQQINALRREIEDVIDAVPEVAEGLKAIGEREDAILEKMNERTRLRRFLASNPDPAPPSE